LIADIIENTGINWANKFKEAVKSPYTSPEDDNSAKMETNEE